LKMIINIRFLALIILCGLFSCTQNHDNKRAAVKISDTYVPEYSILELSKKLDVACEQSSSDSLQAFFTDWNETVKSNSKDFIYQNDTIKAVFDVYKEFYKPLNLLKLGDWEWGNKLNSGCKFIVVQNKLYYAVIASGNFSDFDWSTYKKDSINNFRPPLNLDSNKILYLTTEYDKTLNLFLGSISIEMGQRNIMDPAKPNGESEKRYLILRAFIPILHGHWGGYWHLETHPAASIILFNKGLTLAKVNFRVGYQGGEAILTKEDNGWIIKESRATWIE